MQDLEPPEVPLDLVPQAVFSEPVSEPKKVGFFKRLFSKKESVKSEESAQDFSGQDLPDLDLPKLDLPPLESTSFDINGNITPVDTGVLTDAGSKTGKAGTSKDISKNLPAVPLPSITDEFSELRLDLDALERGKIKNKSKGKLKKGQKRGKVQRINESSQFDWARDIEDQEILIHDSNRFNQDVNVLLAQTDKHIEDKTPLATDNSIFASEHKNIDQSPVLFDIQEPNIDLARPAPEMNSEMPAIGGDETKSFMKMSISHQRLKSQLDKCLHNKKLFNDKAKMLALFKQYDESVEKKIEDKELELTKDKIQLSRLEKHLKEQEKNIRNTLSYIKDLDKKLKVREADFNALVASTVETELGRRLKIDKKALSTELSNTKKLNADLKRKVKIIEDDRVRFEKEHQNMSDMERRKLTALQTAYEKKLKELDAEKKTFAEEKRVFEERRKNVLALISRADAVAKDLEDIHKTKEYVDNSKRFVEKELTEDKELKDALIKAESALSSERENLDKMIFNRYIEKKLKGIKPDYLEERSDWKTALRSDPLYTQISQCRDLLKHRQVAEAKQAYNDICRAYDGTSASGKEKEALYTAIRELYNDIQMKILEMQMHAR